MRHHFCVDFEYTDAVGLSADQIRGRYIEPAAAVLRTMAAKHPGCKFMELDMPKMVEEIYCGPIEGLPNARCFHAMSMRNVGTEEDPNYDWVRMGRLDVLIEVEE